MPNDIFHRLGLADHPRVIAPGKLSADGVSAGMVLSTNPATDEPIAGVRLDDARTYDEVVDRARRAFDNWRRIPAPVRGEIVRRIALELRAHKAELGELVSLEMGKIRSEGEGEVQECIDIADYAVGLSRQLYGLTMPSERPAHRLFEQWHPLGAVGVITAFNFPIAVWAWNAMISAVCGDVVVWKPSLVTPLVAIAATDIVQRVMADQELFAWDDADPKDVFSLVIGSDAEIGQAMTSDRRLPLVSATGSCRMGKEVGVQVASRLGRCLLELGGNNAVILMPDADMDMAVRGIVFGAVGTAGQRCTSTRRLICVGGSADSIIPRLISAYKSVSIGDPLEPGTLMGPLISCASVESMRRAIERAVAEGCEVAAGGIDGIDRFADKSGAFVEPTIVRVPKGVIPGVCQVETFAPILYVFEVETLEEAIELQNGVDQGLSSAIFTDSVRASERFLSAWGSDCGIANVNLGTSGAEIGGAFGGEKDTGGGRESGSDAWKAYMRRQTCTVNFGEELPLAQGVQFVQE